MRTIQRILVMIISTLFLVPVLANCSTSGEREVLVFAAASLRDALTELSKEFEVRENIDVKISYGGSVTLARQIDLGSPADIFISAGDAPVDTLNNKGLLAQDGRRALLINRLVVAVAPDLTMPLTSGAQALQASKRVGIADPNMAPAGQYAKTALTNLGLWDELEPKVVYGNDVRVTLYYAESSNVDSAIVYISDALMSESIGEILELPGDIYPPIVYPAAIIRGSDNQTEASRFLDFLSEDSSYQVFERFGFNRPSYPAN